jgi:hypothetical protein
VANFPNHNTIRRDAKNKNESTRNINEDRPGKQKRIECIVIDDDEEVSEVVPEKSSHVEPKPKKRKIEKKTQKCSICRECFAENSEFQAHVMKSHLKECKISLERMKELEISLNLIPKHSKEVVEKSSKVRSASQTDSVPVMRRSTRLTSIPGF